MAKVNREKGNSLIRFPERYVVIDIETTGLSPQYDEIIEISAIKVESNLIIETFSFLIKPAYGPICDFITNLTGITNIMLASAPKIEKVLPKFYEFIGDSILIGHNVNFDINFLYDEFQKVLKRKLCNDFVDTMRIARRLYPELDHHRLVDVAEKHGICTEGSHRGLKDCEITQDIFVKMKDDVIRQFKDIDKFCITKKKTYNKSNLKRENIVATASSFDEDHFLFRKRCVITGTLENMTRQEAMQIIVNLGGINESAVTKKTNLLILGNNDYNRTKEKGKSVKHLKAEQYKIENYDIEIMPEQVFYDIIFEN